MTEKIKGHGEALRRQVVQEYESGKDWRTCGRNMGNPGDKHHSTMDKEQFGKGAFRHEVVRIQTAEEANQVKQLRKQVDELEQALGQMTLKKLKLESILEEIKDEPGKILKKRSAIIQRLWSKVQEQKLPMNKAEICAQFGISRQAHYQKQQREILDDQEGELVLEMVRQVRRKHPRMGGRKLLYKVQPMVTANGLTMGRDRLFDLLREQNMLVSRKKIFRHTTIPGFWRSSQPIGRPDRANHPNQVWVSDITYLELEVGRFAYLFLLMDLFFVLLWVGTLPYHW